MPSGAAEISSAAGASSQSRSGENSDVRGTIVCWTVVVSVYRRDAGQAPAARMNRPDASATADPMWRAPSPFFGLPFRGPDSTA